MYAFTTPGDCNTQKFARQLGATWAGDSAKLWGERTLCSIANLTRKDGEEFLSLAPMLPIKTEIHTYALKDVNQALDDLRHGRFTGSAVIVI